MTSRFVLVAPLALAAVLNAQETPASPGVTPEQQIKKLRGDKERLQKEIDYAKKQASTASKRLANKLRRGKPNFRSIDAGKPATMLSTAPKRVQRKPAKIGTPDQMKIGGGPAMVVVNRRGIGEQLVNDVSAYLKSYNPKAQDALVAQRVLYDLIRIEGVAGTFVDDHGKVLLGETYASLLNGDMTLAYAAENYATVNGASEKGELTVTRNSVQGPLFEFMAFTTKVGEVSRPFLSPRGWVVLKVDAYTKGEQPTLDKVQCSVALFKFTDDDEEMQQALYTVTSGQAEVYARDAAAIQQLPALYRPVPARPSPRQTLETQLRALQARLQKIVGAGEGESAQAKTLRDQIRSIQKSMENDANVAPKPGTADQDTAPPVKRMRKSKGPAKGKGPVEQAGGGN